MTTRDFYLTGAQGSFKLPAGESRIGSDAACEICIHGEGILPVHAYLRADSGKVLIRPASNEAVSASDRVAITVGGSLITGPSSILEGQGVTIGGVQMTLMREQEKRQSLFSRAWVRWTAYSALGLLALALLAFVYVRYVYLDEEALKSRIRDAVHQSLGRPVEDVEVGSVKVRLFDGRFDIQNFRIKERVDFQSAQSSYFVQIPSTVVTFDIWSYIKSFGREVRKLEIIADGDGIQNPEIVFERSKTDGSLNADDIVGGLSAATKFSWKLTYLDFALKFSNASVHLRDPFTGIGETSLEKINIYLHQPGPGMPMRIDRCEMTVNANPAPPEKGSLTLSGKVNLLDESCSVIPDNVSAEGLVFDMKNFDLARIFEHLGYAWEPHGANFKVVLGKPIQGHLDIARASARELKLQGSLTSSSLLSIKEEKQPPLGNIPMELKIADLCLVKDPEKNGGRFVPTSLDMRLESWLDPAKQDSAFLTFSTNGKLNSTGKYNYSLDLVCGLQELLNTDVGKRLKLDGTLGGGLEGHAELVVDAGQGLGIDARLNGKDTFVMVPVPEDVNKPREKWRMMKQPLPLTFDCFVDARQAANGGIAYIDVQRFLLNASSFKAHSDKPMRIDIRSADEKIKADAQFQLDLRGKEFCREFSPILSLFGFTKSLDEDFDLKITVFGRNDVLGMLTDGKMTRKWSSDPAPVRLKTSLVYNKPALARGEIPYLSMIVLAATSGEKPIELQVEAHCTRRDGRDIIDCVSLDKDGKDTGAPGVIVNADIETLRSRFQPYIEQALQFREGSKTDALWLKFYQDAVLKGEVSQNARFRIMRAANEGANETDRIEFDLKTNTNFKSSVELAKLVPQKMETSPLQPPSPKARFDWEEPKLSLELKGVYEQSVSNNPEEAERLRMLNVERMNFKGSLGEFELGLKNLDLLALPTIRGAGNKEWTDALAGMNIRGTVAPQAAVLLKSLGILDPEDPVSGTVNLEASYEREKDSLDFKKFEFKQAGGFYLSELNASGSLSRVREISAQLFPAQPNRDSLAVRLANWVVKDGADVFFGHLGREMVIHKLRLEARPFREWLTGTFKSGGSAREGSALFSGILDNTFEPNGLWSADNLLLTRDQNLPNTWRLNGALQTGFILRAPGNAYESGAPTLTFSNPWNLELGLALNKDTVAFDGELRLENAEISAKVPGVKMELGWPFSNIPGMTELKKASNEPFKIELAGGATARGVFPMLLNKLRATGNFGSLDLGHFVAEASRGNMRFGVEKFNFNGTQFKCSGSLPTLDFDRDVLVTRIEAPMLELNLLPEMWVLAPHGAGRLKNVSFNYKGGLGSLLASLHPALRPKLDATDPRRGGVNPESDSFELEGDLDGSAINLPNWALALSGRVRLTPSEMTWKNCAATLWRAPNSEPQKVVVEPVQTFSVSKLRAKSADPKLNLRQAFSVDGMPLEISGDIECAGALDDTQLSVLRDALKTLVPGSPLAGAADFAAARRMFITGGLKAPSLVLGGIEAGGLDARNMIFKDLKLSIPLLSTTLLGGKLLLEDAEYDFSKVAARGGPVRGMKGVQHTQRINYSGADLCRLMGGSVSDPAFYSLCGRLDATGHLSGVDFKGIDRLNWNGAQKFTISNFASGAPTLDPAGEGILPALSWMSHFKHHGSKRVEAMARASILDSISPLELSADGNAPPAIKLADGALAGLELYFSKTFGIELAHFEFEPFTPTARIDKGLAVVEPFELKGRGMSEGLDLQVRNLKVNLADEILADDVLIFPTVLPKQAQLKFMLDKWPTTARQTFTNAMASGKLALKISGSLESPLFKFPWSDLRALVRPALFGVDTIVDVESLSRAREHFYRTWGREESALQTAALLAERAGVGLPGTLTTRLLKDSIVERAAKLPPKLMEAVNGGALAVPLTPLESLRLLLTAEPEPPKLTPQPPPPATPGSVKAPGSEPIGKP